MVASVIDESWAVFCDLATVSGDFYYKFTVIDWVSRSFRVGFLYNNGIDLLKKVYYWNRVIIVVATISAEFIMN